MLVLLTPKLYDQAFTIFFTDPFSFNNDGKSITGFGAIKLLGVFSTKNKRYAIIEHNEKTGEIREGERGGVNNSLLPKNAILKKINIQEPHIIIQFEDKRYKFTMKM